MLPPNRGQQGPSDHSVDLLSQSSLCRFPLGMQWLLSKWDPWFVTARGMGAFSGFWSPGHHKLQWLWGHRDPFWKGCHLSICNQGYQQTLNSTHQPSDFLLNKGSRPGNRLSKALRQNTGGVADQTERGRQHEDSSDEAPISEEWSQSDGFQPKGLRKQMAATLKCHD